MIVQRGDVLLALFPFATGTAAKKRPVLVVQADSYNRSMHNAIVAEITTTPSVPPIQRTCWLMSHRQKAKRRACCGTRWCPA